MTSQTFAANNKISATKACATCLSSALAATLFVLGLSGESASGANVRPPVTLAAGSLVGVAGTNPFGDALDTQTRAPRVPVHSQSGSPSSSSLVTTTPASTTNLTTTTATTMEPTTTVAATTTSSSTLPKSTTTTSSSSTTSTSTSTTTTTIGRRIVLSGAKIDLKRLRKQEVEILKAQSKRAQRFKSALEKVVRRRNEIQQELANTPTPKDLKERNRLAVLRRLAQINDDASGGFETALNQVKVENSFLNGHRQEFIGSFVNPVVQKYNTADTYGAPRVGHKHEGIDLFSQIGNPLRATVDGVLRDVKDTRIGGRIVYVTSADGTYYYYAHLDHWAPGIKSGLKVFAGQIIGFMGRTGNAGATPTHLHFEIHPLGGASINPYPIVSAVAKGDEIGFEAATITINRLCDYLAKSDSQKANSLEFAEPQTSDKKTALASAPTPSTVAHGVCKASSMSATKKKK